MLKETLKNFTEIITMEHFGVKLINRGREFKLIKDDFALINTKPSIGFSSYLAKQNAYVDEHGTAYRKEWCEEYRKLCLQNYDLNMTFFSQLDKDEFNSVLKAFLIKYDKFNEIFDLSKYSKNMGYYIMVLDEYKQVYIGKTNDIKRRIMQHWSKTKDFDSTLFPLYAHDTSCFSIDFFRALDTTRIFVWNQNLTIGTEAELVSNFPEKFRINRIGGDIENPIHAFVTMKKMHF